MCTQMYSMEDMTVRETCLTEVKKMSQMYQGDFHDENIFVFFVLINFQLSAKYFSVLPFYFMNREDSLEKTLNFEINFRGDPRDTASTFLKMATILMQS